jgi:cobalamin biosynthesis protein CobD/CbiB
VVEAQIALIDRRAGILRRAIGLAGLTVLLVSVLILVLFIAALFHLELGTAIIALFSLALLSLIGSMIGFLREITLSLEAVRLETQG